MENAYRLVWRSLVSHPVYRRPSTFQVFIHLLLHAAWCGHVRKEGEHAIRVRRGQVITTRRRLHEQLRRGKFTAAARSRLQRELDWLQNHAMIRKSTIYCGPVSLEPQGNDENGTLPGTGPGTLPGTRCLCITICNFNRYQDAKNLNEPRPGTGPGTGPGAGIKNTVKKTEKKKTPARAGTEKNRGKPDPEPKTPAARVFECYAEAFEQRTREDFPRDAIRRDMVILNRLLRRFDEPRLTRLVAARFSGDHPRITKFHDEAGHWGIPAFERFMVDALAVEMNGHYRSALDFWKRKADIERRAVELDREQQQRAREAKARSGGAEAIGGILGDVLGKRT